MSKWQFMQRQHKAVNFPWRTLVDLHFNAVFEWRQTVPVKKRFSHRTQLINLIKVLIFPCFCTLRGSSLLWSSERSAGGRLWKLDDSKAAWGLFVKKYLLRAILHFTQEENDPLQWWHKDCVSYLMAVIFWHVGWSAEMLCEIARGVMVTVG